MIIWCLQKNYITNRATIDWMTELFGQPSIMVIMEMCQEVGFDTRYAAITECIYCKGCPFKRNHHYCKKYLILHFTTITKINYFQVKNSHSI